MRALVVSDSHGAAHNVQRLMALRPQLGNPEMLLHLGDGAWDVQNYRIQFQRAYVVRGNCDFIVQPGTRMHKLVRMDGVDVLMTHGHQQRVKSGLSTLLYTALEKGARVALYGHTHRQLAVWEEGVLLLNPGALSTGQYALLDIAGGGDIQYKLCSL